MGVSVLIHRANLRWLAEKAKVSGRTSEKRLREKLKKIEEILLSWGNS